MEKEIKIFVGSANFGSGYGAIKKENILNKVEIRNILSKIIELPFLFIDTANSYKNSEFLIGKYGNKKLNNKIMTKIKLTRDDNYESVTKLIEKSLGTVQQDTFYSVLVHNAEIFYANNADEIVRALEDCRFKGLTQNIGVSCYEADEVTYISSKYGSLNDFQIPENVVDQRNLNNQNFRALHKSKKSLYIRSVFLQGSLLVEPTKLPRFFSPELEVFYNFKEMCLENGVTNLKVCLDYTHSVDWKAGLVIGVQSSTQLDEILKELSNPIKIKTFSNQTLSHLLVDPRKWNLNI